MPDTPTSSKIHVADLVTCPKCGQSNPFGERYCTSCGAHLVGVVPTHLAQAEAQKRQGFLGRLFGRK